MNVKNDLFVLICRDRNELGLDEWACVDELDVFEIAMDVLVDENMWGVFVQRLEIDGILVFAHLVVCQLELAERDRIRRPVGAIFGRIRVHVNDGLLRLFYRVVSGWRFPFAIHESILELITWVKLKMNRVQIGFVQTRHFDFDQRKGSTENLDKINQNKNIQYLENFRQSFFWKIFSKILLILKS